MWLFKPRTFRYVYQRVLEGACLLFPVDYGGFHRFFFNLFLFFPKKKKKKEAAVYRDTKRQYESSESEGVG